MSLSLFPDLDDDLVDVDLAVSLCDGPHFVLFAFGLVAPTCFGSSYPLTDLPAHRLTG